jgi:hypothetical protein
VGKRSREIWRVLLDMEEGVVLTQSACSLDT